MKIDGLWSEKSHGIFEELFCILRWAIVEVSAWVISFMSSDLLQYLSVQISSKESLCTLLVK